MGYAIQNISSLPFGKIIGGPLVAAIEAQGMAAKSTVDFIMDVGFTHPSDEVTTPGTESTPANSSKDVGEVRMVTFTYTAVIPATTGSSAAPNDGTPHTNTVSIQVPLLTIVPIPFIAIQEVNIDFMAKITEAISYDRTSTSSSSMDGSSEAHGGWGPVGGGLKASFSSKHSSTSAVSSKYNTELTMNVRVRAVQDDMPGGMSKILTILGDVVRDQSARVGVTPNPTFPSSSSSSSSSSQ